MSKDTGLIYLFAANAELLAKLTARQARFIIVGGEAVRFYVPERQADDLDLLVEPCLRNASLVIDAINEGASQIYRFDAIGLAQRNIQWPVKEYYYVDILTPKAGIDFDDVWNDAVLAEVDCGDSIVSVRIAAKATLIEMLRSSQEDKHKRDIEALMRVDDGWP